MVSSQALVGTLCQVAQPLQGMPPGCEGALIATPMNCRTMTAWRDADSEWTLDLRPDHPPSLVDTAPKDNPDLTLTISDDNFAKLVSGKLGQQQVGV
jgi:SCP-2 sterol transfer family